MVSAQTLIYNIRGATLLRSFLFVVLLVFLYGISPKTFLLKYANIGINMQTQCLRISFV